ncbi:MAG: hypothetical protein JW384_03770 [Nitrosomonadaceae bacterium]|nr:hypothetical protein [Nitrosomonadaceae bacterium]
MGGEKLCDFPDGLVENDVKFLVVFERPAAKFGRVHGFWVSAHL